jgi:signal transduction histidine kinase
MMVRPLSRFVGLSVGQRLLLGLAPALLAVILVIGLAYYGRVDRQAPHFMTAGAAILAIASLVVTWFNTQYLARRIRRLAVGADPAEPRAGQGGPEDDELGRIEQVVERLGTALTDSEAERKRALADGQARVAELATMLAASVRDAIARLDDVRLPLHILIDAPFGELNENQEELLVTARAAADEMDGVLRRLALVADADRDNLAMLLERVSINDVVRGVLPMLRAAAERRGGQVSVDLDPMLPRILADRARLAEAIARLGGISASAVTDGGAMQVSSARDGADVRLRMTPGPSTTGGENEPDRFVAARLVMAQGGTLVTTLDGGLELRLPIERPS